MDKTLSERIKKEIISLTKQQRIFSHLFAIVGLVGLGFVFFGVYVNTLEETKMQQIINPQLDWTIIGSLFIFLCYCLIGVSKFVISYRTWKLKKEQLSIERHCAYRYVHPVKKESGIFINQKLLQELEAKNQ